jgi:UDP-N-acetylglucosamine 2-epimerase (non-hydrolysing)
MSAEPLRVLTVFGTRPEAIKLAPVIARLRAAGRAHVEVCVTAQHREMLDQVLDLFEISPDYDLDLMRPDQSLAGLTAAVFSDLEPVLDRANPDWLVIQGDTTTVMAAALLAYYHRINIGHVEAGLRTGDKWQPFPEEINRRVAGAVADLHFAPTEWARRNLLAEGVQSDRVFVTGNPVIDALLQVASLPYEFDRPPLDRLPADRKLVLLTAHRRESFGAPFERMLGAVRKLAKQFAGRIVIVYPVHLNPNVQVPAERILGGIENVHLVEPLAYLPMVHLMKRARLILTDSGGIQEEAPALGVPVLVLRDKTERPEAIESGTAKLVGTDPDRVFEAAAQLIMEDDEYQKMAQAASPYGDGHAAERIAELLLRSTP